MEPAPKPTGIFWTGEHRVRLGWRMLLYVVGVVGIAGLLVPFLPGQLIGPQTALLVGAVVAGVLLLKLDGRPAAALGFPLGRRTFGETLAGLGLGTAVALIVVGLIAAVGGLRWTVQDGSVVAWLLGAAGALLFLALPAAAEEALVRGYPLQALAEAWGPVSALLVTAGVFGLLHALNPNLTPLGSVNVALAGIFLGVVYLRTGSLWWATGVHLGWNWAHGYLTDVPVSGLELLDAPLYDGLPAGPGWLGGGAFGPEGSALTSLVVAGAVLVCWRARWLRPSDAVLEARPLALVRRDA